MKRFILLIFIPIISLSILAQDVEGTYRNSADSIVFSGDNITFRVSGFAGLTTAQVGEGKFEIINNFLLVHTTEYSGDKSSFQELEGSKKDTCIVKVVSKLNHPVQGILIESKNSSNKIVSAKVTGNDGRVNLIDQDKTNKINVSAMGYNPISFDFKTNKDYLVRIAENDVIENRTVVFKYDIIDEETISLLLLTDDFKSGNNTDNELNKLDKRAKRRNLLHKRYSKEFIPFRL